MKRRGFAPDAVAAIKAAYKTLYKSGLTLDQAKDALAAQAGLHAEVGLFLDFLRDSRRGIVR
jgi:UDP-N-acetylglucosamine acyltransferase